MFSSFIFNSSITIIISICIISLLHWFWEYIKDNYSTKKVKDLVNTQIEKYKNLASTNIIERTSPNEEELTEEEKTSMQEDLQNLISTISGDERNNK